MLIRPTVAIAVVTLVLAAACSAGGGVPDDQVIKPTKPPAGWTATDLGKVTVSAPPGWVKGDTESRTEAIDITTWRSAAIDGTSPSGMEVKVISAPQQNARKATQALAVSAMALLKGGSIDPVRITWPQAEDAYYLDYEATSGSAAATYATRTAVFDLPDGTQVQVTALAATGTEVAAPEQALESVVLDKTEKKD